MYRRGGGSIVIVGSMRAYYPDPSYYDYCATKAAVTNIAKALSNYKLISVREDGHDHGAHPKLNGLLAGIERSGASVTITNHGRRVAVLIPAHQGRRRFVQLPALAVADI